VREEDEHLSNSSKQLSRRDFLKLAAAGAATAAVLTSDIPLSPEYELSPTSMVLDFFDVEKAQERFIKENFPEDFDAGETFKDMGVTDPNTREGLRQAVPTTEDQAKLFMMKAFEVIYKEHGNDVVRVMNNTRDYLGAKNNGNKDVEKQSVVDAVTLGELEFDGLGNPTLHRSIDPEKVNDLLEKTEESLINMSLELGDGVMTYELYEEKMKYPDLGRQMPYTRGDGENMKYYDYMGNEIHSDEYNAVLKKSNERVKQLLDPEDRTIVSVDGYAGDQTENNLRMLVDICRKHPDKMFFAAGGNPSYLKGIIVPDIREARRKIESEGLWPENLLIVGYHTKIDGVEVPASYGDDIYVKDEDLSTLKFYGASSWATPVIHRISQQLVESGINTDKKIKRKLNDFSELKTVYFGEEAVDYKVLNLDNAKDYISG
jgi:hypothetical protein